MRVEAADLHGRVSVNDRALQEVRDERDIFRKVRDQIQAKLNELTAHNERIERELNTKRLILAEYDQVKKGEIELLQWKIDM